MTYMPPTGPVPPVFKGSAFDCPFCGAFANMAWLRLVTQSGSNRPVYVTKCARCSHDSIWLATDSDSATMLWPRERGGIPPHADMPDDARVLYEEARDVANLSPRAAVALLRVALDVLLREVVPDADGKSLNDVIKLAVDQGLTPQAWAAMDALRVIGNDAVHPDQLVLDEAEPGAKVTALCRLMNLIVEQLVSAPRLALQVFDTLPEGAKAGIERRSGGLPGA